MNITLLAIIVVIYLLIISYLGWRGYKATKTAADYLVAGRGVHPYIMALSYGATFISTSAIIGFGGVAGLFGLSLLWLTFLNIIIGIFIAFVFFGKRTRRMSHHLNAHTFPEFLGFRYQSRFVQVSAGLMILSMVLYAAGVLIGAGRHLEGIMGVSFHIALLIITLIVTAYVIAGGLKGVMYTDAFQGTIMFIGMFLLLFFTLSEVGGFSKAHQNLEKDYAIVTSKEHLQQHIVRIAAENELRLDKEQAFELGAALMKTMSAIKEIQASTPEASLQKQKIDEQLSMINIAGVTAQTYHFSQIMEQAKPYILQYFILNKVQKGGHRGWAAMPEGNTPIWWLIISTITMGVGIGVLAQPQLSVRFMTVKSDREINRSILVGGVFIIIMTGVAFVIGSFSNSFFFDKLNGLVSIGVAGGNVDKIIPLFLKDAMPTWFNYIFLLTLLSAAMSTLSSQFHTMGTAISRDIGEATGMISPDQTGGAKSIFAAKIGVAFMILATVILSYIMPGGIIAAATAIFFGICASAFLPSLVGALYWKRASRVGAISSMLTGFFVSLFWLLLVHNSTVQKLGWPSILGKSNWANVDPLLIALPVSLAVYIIVSLATKPIDESHLEKCFQGIS